MDTGEQACGARRDTRCSGESHLGSLIFHSTGGVSLFVPHLVGDKIHVLPKLQPICNNCRNFHIAPIKGRPTFGKKVIENACKYDPKKKRHRNTLICKIYSDIWEGA